MKISARTVLHFAVLSSALCAFGQTEKRDSIKAKELNEIVVEARLQRTDAQKFLYFITAPQRYIIMPISTNL